MRIRYCIALLLLALTTACAPLGPAPTPTMVPLALPDPGMQQAALAAVREYAQRLGYEHKTPSFTIVDTRDSQTTVHVTVAFQTRKGFPYEDHDALIKLRRTATGWKADPISKFTKLEWEQDLQRGPTTLKSPAGFVVQVPEGYSGFVSPASELIAISECGIGMEPVTGSPILAIMPIGYSAENVPLILRGFQQCPRAPGLSVIRQRLENIRDTDKSFTFQRLEMMELAGKPMLVAVLTDSTGATLYDYYVLHRDRQLEFVIQVHANIDATPLLNVMNSIRFE